MAYTTIDDGSAYFQTKLYTGTGSSNSVTNDGNSDLQPDWVWIKERDGTGQHGSFDSSRGVQKELKIDEAGTESTAAQSVTAFNSDGFTVGTAGDYNGSSNEQVAWQWKANGGSRTTFSESGSNAGGGYQANTTAGFSIIDYTGTGSSGATITHGLGAVPKFYVVKGRSIGDSWTSYHAHNTSAPETDMLKLDENSATQDNVVFFNDTAPTSSVFTVDCNNGEPKVNQDGQTYIAYCFTEIQGYSKFGKYTGNNSADGTFVYTGFKPAFIMIKRTDSSGSWVINDSTRNPTNQANNTLVPDETWVESTNDYYAMDILSNGFKLRKNSPEINGSSTTQVYMAFAEHPFVSSEGVPCTAR